MAGLCVLGVDPGLAITGYGVIAGTMAHAECLEYGVITSTAAMAIPERLRRIHQRLAEIVARCAPEAVAVESAFVARNPQAALSLGQVRGVALLAAANAGLPVYEYAPRRVKELVSGYGGSPKAQVQEMIRLHLGLDARPRPDDAADALAVALCHLLTASTLGAYAREMPPG